MKARLKDDPAN